MANFGRAELLTLLHELDRRLTAPLEITVCGGAAGILCHGLRRGTLDIDVVQSLPALPATEAARRSVAEARGLGDGWLNDGAKGFVDYLPDGFMARRVPVGDHFARLRVFALARVDLLVMKLMAFRPEDIVDVLAMGIGGADIEVIRRTVDKVSRFDAKKAYAVTMFLKERSLL